VQKDTGRYEASIRTYAAQWTDAQIREAIADERRILGDQSLSDVARDNSHTILSIYESVLTERGSGSSAA